MGCLWILLRVELSEVGDATRVFFACIKCSNETAWVKFKTFKKWDVYGYCYGCHAKYKKTDCKTNSHTHRTTRCFQLTTDESFVVPEIVTCVSSDDDIHPHFQLPRRRSRKKRSRTAERVPQRERISSQGDTKIIGVRFDFTTRWIDFTSGWIGYS